MKLLHVIASMNPTSGGPCQGIRSSDAEMHLYGVQREIVSLDNPDNAFLGMDDFPIYALGPVKTPWQYSPKLLPWLIEHVCDFDVVIINGLWLYSSYAAWKAIRVVKKQIAKKNDGRKVPKIYVMPHGMLDPYFQRAADRRLKAIRNLIYWELIEKHVVNDADGLLFTCEMEMVLARKTFKGYRPKKEMNVGYGIKPPPEYNDAMRKDFLEKCPEVEGEPYLLFLSRIHEKKGVDLLIDAYAKLIASGYPLPKLVIAGPGLVSSFGKRVHQMAYSNPQLQDKVYFPGMLYGNAKWGALYGSDAFILPSHQENFGIAVVEALACAKPVLISNQINIYMEIEAGGAGIIADDTIDGTIQMLKQWLELSADKRRDAGNRALRIFNDNFHITSSSIAFTNAIK